jgi:3',5'-cyclic AMP phosphodiesterase CpdA
MPIYLPPLSRRRFLARSLAAGVGLALNSRAFAANKPTDPDFWALFSDIHLAANRAQLGRGVNMADHFRNASEELLALPKRPAGLFVVGDCAFNSGEKGDYATVAEMLEPIRAAQVPVHLALGNHDHRERFWEAFEEEKAAKRPVAERQTAMLPTPRANFFVLDSLDKTLATPGRLGEEQLKWLAEALDANARKPAIVFIHHNPGLHGNMGLIDTLGLWDVIRPRKQVKAYIYGHTHTWKVERDSSGIHLINLPPVAYVFEKGYPSGWVHTTLQRQGMRLELRCTDPTHQAHGQIVNLKWRA